MTKTPSPTDDTIPTDDLSGPESLVDGHAQKLMRNLEEAVAKGTISTLTNEERITMFTWALNQRGPDAFMLSLAQAINRPSLHMVRTLQKAFVLACGISPWNEVEQWMSLLKNPNIEVGLSQTIQHQHHQNAQELLKLNQGRLKESTLQYLMDQVGEQQDMTMFLIFLDHAQNNSLKDHLLKTLILGHASSVIQHPHIYEAIRCRMTMERIMKVETRVGRETLWDWSGTSMKKTKEHAYQEFFAQMYAAYNRADIAQEIEGTGQESCKRIKL